MRRYLLAAAAAAAAIAVGVPGSASAAPAHQPASQLHGFARLALGGPALSPDYQITLRMDAEGDPSGADGHATIQHVFYENGSWIGTVRVEVSVDCLTGTGAGASATTVVTGTAARIRYITPPGAPALQQPRDWHPEVAFSFSQDTGGHRRVGWSGKPAKPTDPPVATRCQAPHTGPDLYLAEGGFRLTH